MSVEWHPHPEPLPGDADPSLVTLDDLLAAEAARLSIPEGLAERVFDASVVLLPVPPRVVVAGRLQIHRTAWGRLAMAASLGLAFVLGARFLRPSPVLVERPAVVMTQLSREAELVLADAWGSGATELHDLLETRDATLNDLTGEIAMLVADLEM